MYMTENEEARKYLERFVAAYDLTKRYGSLIYNKELKRLDIIFDDGETYGGLHCGKYLEVFIDLQFGGFEWRETFVEMGLPNQWCLIDAIEPKSLPPFVNHKIRVRV